MARFRVLMSSGEARGNVNVDALTEDWAKSLAVTAARDGVIEWDKPPERVARVTSVEPNAYWAPGEPFVSGRYARTWKG